MSPSLPSVTTSLVSPLPSVTTSLVSPLPSVTASLVSPLPSVTTFYISLLPSVTTSLVSPLPSVTTFYISPLPSVTASHVPRLPCCTFAEVSNQLTKPLSLQKESSLGCWEPSWSDLLAKSTAGTGLPLFRVTLRKKRDGLRDGCREVQLPYRPKV